MSLPFHSFGALVTKPYKCTPPQYNNRFSCIASEIKIVKQYLHKQDGDPLHTFPGIWPPLSSLLLPQKELDPCKQNCM